MCLCGGLFICAPVRLFGWLVVCVCVCLLVFWHLGAHFGFVVALCGPLWRLCGTLGTLGGHLGTLVVHLGTLGGPIWVLLALWGVALDPFGHFWGRGLKKVPKMSENGSQNRDIFNDMLSLGATFHDFLAKSVLLRFRCLSAAELLLLNVSASKLEPLGRLDLQK